MKTEQEHRDEIDASYKAIAIGMQTAIDGFHYLADYHEANPVPRGYSRSAGDLQLYRDVAKLLDLVNDAMGEGGITSQEDWKMTKAMECLGLSWR